MQGSLLVIHGPTAVGKTRHAIAIAKALNTVIVSADSRQIYKELSIGTAKPNETEREGIPHNFIDHCSITENFTAGDYEREASLLLERLFKEHRYVVLTGGTEFYIHALLNGLDDFPTIPTSFADEMKAKLATWTLDQKQKRLQELDPKYVETVDLENGRRLDRAILVSEYARAPYSSFLRQKSKALPYTVKHLVLEMERSRLYDRINKRVDQMVDQGLEQEVRQVLKYRDLKSLDTVGYKEWFPYFDGTITSKEQVIEQIKINSRRYAKRQLTWLRRYPEWPRLHSSDEESIRNWAFE